MNQGKLVTSSCRSPIDAKVVIDASNIPHAVFGCFDGNASPQSYFIQYVTQSPQDVVDSSGSHVTVWGTPQTIQSGLQNTYLHVQIQVDQVGNVHVAYCDLISSLSPRPANLRYARLNKGAQSWSIQTVDTLQGIAANISLVLDSSGNPRIAYTDSYSRVNPDDSGDLKYAAWNGASWSVQTVDTLSSGNCGNPSLALDSSNRPHISYMYGTTTKYARWTGSAWDMKTVDNAWGSYVQDATSLFLDSSGNAHVAYWDGRNADPSLHSLKYASWTGSSWSVQTIDSGKWATGRQPFMTVDQGGEPHILYEDDDYGANTYNLKHARWNGAVWATQPVLSDTLTLFHTFAFFSDNNPLILTKINDSSIGADFFYAGHLPPTDVSFVDTSTVSSAGASAFRSPAASSGPGIVFHWKDNSSDETGYRIRRKSDGMNLSGDLPANTTSYTLMGMTPDEVDRAYVEVFGPDGTSRSSILYVKNGFSVSGPSKSVEEVKGFPNPFRPDRGQQTMNMTDLPANAAVKIYTLTGEFVRQLTTNEDGVALWDGRNERGGAVASGIYVLRASGPGGNKTFKMAVQR